MLFQSDNFVGDFEAVCVMGILVFFSFFLEDKQETDYSASI